jgi:glycosyltransferase involved in cell wall biosynthesis
VSIIPNGVNLDMFCPQNHLDARARVGFDADKRYAIWCSHPDRLEKNYALAQAAVELVKEKYNVELLPIYNKTPQEVVQYMNAADCLLLTSVQEGSPNVIKEAMACNCPIVSTDVGDVRERLTGLEGCYILPEKDMQSSETLANLIEEAICYGKRTEGYNRIIKDELTIQQIAKRIMECYD